MSNPNATYLINDAILLDWDKLLDIPDDCYLVALSLREISVLNSLMRYAEARHLWRQSDLGATWANDVEPFVNQLKGALLMGCNINDLVSAINGVEAAIRNQYPLEPGGTTNGLLDQISNAIGTDADWNVVKAGLSVFFPEAAIPINIGLDVLRALVQNANSPEMEIFEVAKMLGSTAVGLPDND